MPVSLDLKTARKILDSAWSNIHSSTDLVSSALMTQMKEIVCAADVTYKYIVVTGLLAKSVSKEVHPRALQAGSKLPGAYDARSLCHKVVVDFEKTKGNLWGLSNEPFLNKPARHPEHDKSNKQLRSKALASSAHDILEAAHRASSKQTFNLLVAFLGLSKEKMAASIHPVYTSKPTLSRLRLFLNRFLEESNGGARLSAVVGAYITLLNAGFAVEVYAPNVSDKFADTAGDIEIYDDKTVIGALECKDRPITLSDIRHGIAKAKAHALNEYSFVHSSGLVDQQRESILEEIRTNAEDMDVCLLSIEEIVSHWTAALNQVRRSKYVVVLERILREDMRLPYIANEAATIWNSLEEGRG